MTTPQDTAPEQYSRSQKLLHWAVVLLIAAQYLLFDRMGRAFHALIDGTDGAYTVVSVSHITVGALILALALWRLVLRQKRGVPALPAGEPGWAALLARVTHGMLYALLIALPVLGLAAWFLGLRAAAGLHETATALLLWVAGLHVAGALVHQFVWKDGLIRRMT